VQYDADLPLDPAAWLAADEGERAAAVERHHRGRVERLHPKGYDRRMHARLHVIVENQVAEGVEATRRTIDRVVDSGVRRHVAVHMVIDALLQQIGAGVDFDDAAWAARLDALDPADWLGDRMKRDLRG
jgi:hypothetical protein